jgi:hypothetical protein
MNVAPIVQRSLRAGDGLAERAILWGTHKTNPKTTIPTRRDLRLMALLYDTNYLSTSQLTLLGWGRDSDAAGKRLRRLHDSGYLDKFRGPAAIGTSEWNYRLTAQGRQTLSDSELITSTNYKPADLHSISYAEHDLQLNALILHMAHTAAHAADTPLLDRMPFQWQGPRTGRIDLQASGVIQVSEAARLPPDTRLRPGQSRPGYLEPDATLTGRHGSEHFAILIEYDRTNRPHRQIDRLRRYDHWLLDGWRHTHFATHAIPPTILFISAHPGPLASIIDTADKTLMAWYGPPYANPQEGTYPARQRIIFTSRPQILDGDWRMQRTPHLPPPVRRTHMQTGHAPARTVHYDLSAIFAGPQ